MFLLYAKQSSPGPCTLKHYGFVIYIKLTHFIVISSVFFIAAHKHLDEHSSLKQNCISQFRNVFMVQSLDPIL